MKVTVNNQIIKSVINDKPINASFKGGRGAQGIDGIDGLSAYQIALENGFVGTEAQWLASLQGEDGDPATNLVTSVAGRQGVVVLTKSDVGLGNVDNTSDANKPISTVTQTALNEKVDKVAGERLINAAEITKLGNQSGTNTGDQNDHGLMVGLGDDDHTQYMLLSGRVGGQTLIGGTAASNNLTLSSTANATKGSIIFGDSRYNESTNRLSFGTATGTGRINLPDGGTTSADGIQFGTEHSIYRNSSNVLIVNAVNILRLTTAGSQRLYIDGTQVISLTPFSITPSTLTGSSATSALSITQTWNTTGNPTAIFLNVTNTASGASSNLIDLQVGGVSGFCVNKSRLVGIGTNTPSNNLTVYGGNADVTIKMQTQSTGQTSVDGFNFSVENSTNHVYFNQRENANMYFLTSNTTRMLLDNTGSLSIGTAAPNASSALDIQSTTKGFLPPRMTTTQASAIASPAEGLMIYVTNTNGTFTVKGWYGYNGAAWERLNN